MFYKNLEKYQTDPRNFKLSVTFASSIKNNVIELWAVEIILKLLKPTEKNSVVNLC